MKMKHLLIKAFAGSSLLLLTLTANAQYQPRPENPYPDQREAGHHRLFDRVRSDLDRADAAAVPYSGDRDRVAIAREEVNECQRAVATGEFDQRTFGETIGAIQRVVDLNRMTARSRSFLTDDISALRDLQARLEG